MNQFYSIRVSWSVKMLWDTSTILLVKLCWTTLINQVLQPHLTLFWVEIKVTSWEAAKSCILADQIFCFRIADWAELTLNWIRACSQVRRPCLISRNRIHNNHIHFLLSLTTQSTSSLEELSMESLTRVLTKLSLWKERTRNFSKRSPLFRSLTTS